MFIALIIPFVNIASGIVFYVLIFKRIGGKFLIGVLMVPILLGISVAISRPIYKGYMERAKITEATSIMGAIITSQKVEKQRQTNFYAIPLRAGGTNVAAFKAKGINVSDTKLFTYQTAMIGAKPNDGFTVTATTTDDFGVAGGWMTFTHDPTAIPTNSWTCDGWIILPDMLPTQPGG